MLLIIPKEVLASLKDIQKLLGLGNSYSKNLIVTKATN